MYSTARYDLRPVEWREPVHRSALQRVATDQEPPAQQTVMPSWS